MKIGVAISSFNRPAALATCLESVRSIQTPEPFELLIVDDCSNVEHLQGLHEMAKYYEAVILFSNERLGIARNKNRAFRHFADCDYVFMLEDDTLVLSNEWITEHLRASTISGWQHFCHYTYLEGGRGAVAEVKFGGLSLTLTEHASAMVLFFTRRCIETAGIFDERFEGYGWEHMELTERIRKLGLCGPLKLKDLVGGKSEWGHPVLSNISQLIGSQHLDSALSVEDRKVQQAKNMELWKKIRGQV